MEFNPYLKPTKDTLEDTGGGTGYIEAPADDFFNMVWQTREAPPDEYQLKLSAVLAELFDAGHTELGEIISGLEDSDVRPPKGGAWTEQVFRSEMLRLGK